MRKFGLLTMTVAVVAAGVFAGSAMAGPLVNFEDFEAGDDVTGAGTAHPSLQITPVPSEDAVEAVVTGVTPPSVMGAPNCGLVSCGSGVTSQPNNCLEDADGVRVDANTAGEGETAVGFANVTAQGFQAKQEFDFTFVGNVTASGFSIRVFDLGDFNPANGTSHGISLTAKDGDGNVLDQDIFEWDSSTANNPRASGSSVGDLAVTGDACDANGPNAGEPGYLQLSVNAPTGASKIELRSTGAPDPNVAFDSIDFTACTRTIGFWKNHSWDGLVAIINDALIAELEGRSNPVDEKPGNGYLWQAKGKNFSMLYAQLIAAKLNCGGSGDCSSDGSITAAEQFLLSAGINKFNFDDAFASKSQKQTAASLSADLDAFNNGFECQEAASLQ